MRRTRLLASVLCLLWIGLASAGAAENQKDKAAAGSSRHGKAAKVSHGGRGIALLGRGGPVQGRSGVQEGEEELKADMARAEIDLKNEGGRVQAEGAEVEKLPADSPQRSGRQSQLIRRKADLQVRLQGLRDQFSQRQSKVYSKFYQKIHGVVDAVCEGPQVDRSSSTSAATWTIRPSRRTWPARWISPSSGTPRGSTSRRRLPSCWSKPVRRRRRRRAASRQPERNPPRQRNLCRRCRPHLCRRRRPHRRNRRRSHRPRPEDRSARGAVGRPGRAPENLPPGGRQGRREAPRGLVRR